jgi:hypothetical protein
MSLYYSTHEVFISQPSFFLHNCPADSQLNFQSQIQSQSHFTTGGLPPISSSRRQAPLRLTTSIFFRLNTCVHRPYVTSSLTRGRVCHLHFLLALTSTVILGSESCGIHDHSLLSQIRDSSNLEGQVPIFISLRKRVARLYPQALGSLFVASDSQGYCGFDPASTQA